MKRILEFSEFGNFDNSSTAKVSDLEQVNQDYEYAVLFFYDPKIADLKEEDIEYSFDQDLLDEALTFDGKVYMKGTMPAIAIKREHMPLTDSPRAFYVDDPKLAALKDDSNVELVTFDLDSDADKMDVSTATLENHYISGSFAVIEV